MEIFLNDSSPYENDLQERLDVLINLVDLYEGQEKEQVKGEIKYLEKVLNLTTERDY